MSSTEVGPKSRQPRFVPRLTQRGGSRGKGQRKPMNLAEMVELYAVAEYLPKADWITHLHLIDPRKDIRCLSRGARFFKRMTDVILATTMLIVLSPLLLAAVIAVKLSSSGPVIYTQRRIGLNLRGEPKKEDRRRQPDSTPPEGQSERRSGQDRRQRSNYGKPFTMYKFRTMRLDAESTGAQFTQERDPRVTLVGRFMRRTRIDELPQLINVLRGEMSMIGPRPERPEFIEELSEEIPDFVERLGLRPGITGLAQVINGYGNEVDGFRRKVALDLLYLQNCCLWNDIKILIRTVGVVITGKGAL